MKKLVVIAMTLLMASSAAFADVYVQGYYRKDGTYVAPHHRSSPNSTTYDNWSTKGNVNPYTGERGTKEPHDNYGRSGGYGHDRSYGDHGHDSPHNYGFDPYYRR